MDPSASDKKILSDIVTLHKQQLQLQQQQLVAEGGLPASMETAGPSRLHGSTVSLDIAGKLQSPARGVLSGASFSGRGPSATGSQGVTAASLSHLSSGVTAQSSTSLAAGRTLGYRGIKRPREKVHGQEYYSRQLRRLKKTIKEYIFLNSCVCDEVIRVEEKLARVKEERRYLLRKLLQFQSVSEGSTTSTAAEVHSTPTGPKSTKGPAGRSTDSDQSLETSAKKSASKKKAGSATVGSGGDTKKKLQSQAAKDLLESLQAKPKKSKSQSNRKTIPPMQLDSLGRPVFPMMLGDLTLHSIGEIVPDRNTFNSHECIYPAGFCSTRVFASMTQPQEKCLYTCKISDCGDVPEFEIAPEEGTEQVFRGSTPDECHVQLMQSINAALGADLLNISPGHGADFFGLTNPVVQNLIQSCPGAKKCSGYKWIRFEINKAETNENVAVGKTDPTIGMDAFHQLLRQAAVPKPVAFSPPTEHSTNLRSLLTKGSVPFGGQM